jgi:hypothetical protein
MRLLPQEVAETLPPLYSSEKTEFAEKTVHAQFFDPYTKWAWYVCEYDPGSSLFFGYVAGLAGEWGDFTLDDLQSPTQSDDITPRIEWDMSFSPSLFKDLNI